ncbi:MAG: type II secretion system F family protein [Clostridiales bacterium]|nr:type II secretion system F family protein [Clostridiales bacterium]
MRSHPRSKILRRSRNTDFDIYLKKHIWLYPVLSLFVYAASSMFLTGITIRLVCAALLPFFPWREILRHFWLMHRKSIGTQILVLLQILCTGVSSGYSIERSFMSAGKTMENTFGRKCSLLKPLSELENNLQMHLDISTCMNIFSEEISYPETAPVFHALAISAKMGNNSLSILRSSCQMLSDLNSVQSDIQAENAGKNAEAGILCAMPFVITAAMNGMNGTYLLKAKESPLGTILFTAAFAIAVTSCALLFRFISHSNDTGRKKAMREKTYPSLIGKAAVKITDMLPRDYLASRIELFSTLSLDPARMYRLHLQRLAVLVPSSVIIAAAVLKLAGLPLVIAPFFGLLMVILSDWDIRRSSSLKKEHLMKDIPLFFCLVTTLLESGIQLPKAIDICSRAFDEEGELSLEIKGIKAMMLSGISASDAIERFSLRIGIPEAQSALLLMARYGRSGTREVLNLLSLQSSACWTLCRNAARKKQERESLGLLFPMVLDFISVLIVATTPAVISLGI